MSGYAGGYAIAPFPTAPGVGTEAADGAVLYWDAVGNLVKGSPNFVFDETLKRLVLQGTTPAVEDVAWTDVVGCSLVGNTLTKTAAGSNWTAGARSVAEISAGDGYVEWTVHPSNGSLMCGLGSGTNDFNYTTIDFAIYTYAVTGKAMIYESGAFRVQTDYVVGDTLRVAIVAGVVKYYRNGSLIYTSAVSPTYPLYADSALNTQGATISDAVFSGAQPVVQYWKNDLGSVVASMDTGGGLTAGSINAGSLTTTGGITSGGQLLLPSTVGITGAPALSFAADTDTGISYITGAANRVYVHCNGSARYGFDENFIFPTADISQTLGLSGNRWKTGYFGGAAASQGLIVKAHASQTANLQEWQNSSGTALTFIKKNGAIDVVYAAGGISAAADYDNALTTKFISNGKGYCSGWVSEFQQTGGISVDSQNFYGITYGVTGNTGSNARGYYSLFRNLSSAAFGTMSGFEAYANHTGTGTLTNSFSYKSKVYKGLGGTATNVYHYHAAAPVYQDATAIITNLYGLYIEKQSGAATINRAIYSAGGQVELLTGAAGVIGLSVKADASQTANLQEWQKSDGTVYSRIKADGRWRHDGATTWDDLRVSMTNVKLAAANQPTWSLFKDNGAGSGGVYAYSFSASVMNEVFFEVQMPHGWKEGTAISPHLHWAPATTNTGDALWRLEYTKVTINGTFGNTTIINGLDAGDGTAFKHQLNAVFPDIDMTGDLISTVLLCRLFRDAGDGTDTFTGAGFALSFDFHYQQDAFGSDTIATK